MGSRINTEFSLGAQVKTVSNHRPRVRDGRNVTIDVWDYRTDRWTTETMPGEEFVRRFMLHIIP
ncbi:MAG: transposase, partial [Pirellula sp.]